MEENIDWLFDDPLPSVDLSGCDHHWKTEMKCEAGFEDQLHGGTVVKAENSVKEEVVVKVEGEDKASVKQSLCLSAPGDCDACDLKCGRSEGSSEGGCSELEGEKFKRSVQGKCHLLTCVLLRRVPEIALGSVDSLGLSQGEQCMEGVCVCQQEQAVDSPAGWVRCPVVKVEGGGVCGSVCGTEEEEGRRDVGWEGVVHPLLSLGDCKMEVKPVSTDVRGSVCVAQWSEGSSASVASSSSTPEVSEPRPCVSSQKTAELSPLEKRHCSPPRQQQCRKKGRVQSPGGVVHQDGREVSSPHSDEMKDHVGLRRHSCPHCDFRCAFRSLLGRHVKTVHESLRKYACPHCQYRTGKKGNLQTHIDTVHLGLRKYPCPHCQYRAGQKGNLQKHIDTVHEDLRKYPCPHCQYRAGQKDSLQRHIDTVHEGLRKYPCPQCQYRSVNKGYLQKHIDTVHEGLRKYPCPQCQYRAGQKGTLQRHIDTVHEGLRKNPCPHCQYRAGEKGTLQIHIDTVHEGLKKYPCPHCQYRAGEKGTLQTHIDNVHLGLRKYPCPHCQYRAGQKGNLQTHIDNVHEGLRKYPCPHCQYRAGEKGTLQTHIDNVHEGLRKYPCPHCQYRAGKKGTLQRHIDTVHLGLRKYPCPHCQHRAGKKSDLQKHIKKVHEA